MSDLLVFLQVSVFGIGRTMIDPSSVEYLRLFFTYSFTGGIIGLGIGMDLTKMIIIILNMMRANPMLLLSTTPLMFILLVYYVLALLPFSISNLAKSRPAQNPDHRIIFDCNIRRCNLH